MIINMSGGGSPGKIVTVHVTYGNATGSGANVVCTNGKKTFAGTADSGGDAVFKLPKGTWTITADKNGSTSSMSVNVSEDCTVNISLFAATINVTYPAGSTCTATDGTTTLTAPNTSGTWACVVPNTGTWTVSLGSGYKETVTVNASGENHTVKKWHLFNLSNQCNYITGGWSSVLGDPKCSASFDKGYFEGYTPGYAVGLITNNRVPLNGFSNLFFVYTLPDSANNSSNYTNFGIGTHTSVSACTTIKPSNQVTSKTTVSLNISNVGGYDTVFAMHWYQRTFRVYEIWLEV